MLYKGEGSKQGERWVKKKNEGGGRKDEKEINMEKKMIR